MPSLPQCAALLAATTLARHGAALPVGAADEALCLAQRGLAATRLARAAVVDADADDEQQRKDVEEARRRNWWRPENWFPKMHQAESREERERHQDEEDINGLMKALGQLAQVQGKAGSAQAEAPPKADAAAEKAKDEEEIAGMKALGQLAPAPGQGGAASAEAPAQAANATAPAEAKPAQAQAANATAPAEAGEPRPKTQEEERQQDEADFAQFMRAMEEMAESKKDEEREKAEARRINVFRRRM
mmetsp:Transcript_17166/g.54146  ORF Transcript_17166/g.54146 Transcript_17166/m.54146 type:complete len:246 (+) Transcript_17166:82-819(+)